MCRHRVRTGFFLSFMFWVDVIEAFGKVFSMLEAAFVFSVIVISVCISSLHTFRCSKQIALMLYTCSTKYKICCLLCTVYLISLKKKNVDSFLLSLVFMGMFFL